VGGRLRHVSVSQRVWKLVEASSSEAVLELTSRDGDEGYPGEVTVRVTYSLTPDAALVIRFDAESDADTVLNLCNHTYWNLSGNCSCGIHDHELQLECSHFIGCKDLIPTGDVLPVADTTMDLTKPTRLGDRLALVDGGGRPGYDACFVRENSPRSIFQLSPIAR
jgi:aldose 1-epimerase